MKRLGNTPLPVFALVIGFALGAAFYVGAQTAPSTPATNPNIPALIPVSVDPTGTCTMNGLFTAPYFGTINLATGLQSTCLGGNWISPATLTAYGSLTTAQVNAGFTAVAANANRTAKILHYILQATGGAATTCTSINVNDTTNVVGAAAPIAGLTQNTIVTEATASQTLTTFLTGLTAGAGIKIASVGTACTVMTGLNYEVNYTYN